MICVYKNLFQRPLKLRSHLILLVLAAVLPLLLFATVLVWQEIEQQRSELDDSMLRTARALTLLVDREVGIAQAVLQTLGESEFLDSGDLRSFYDLAVRTTKNRAGSWIALFDASGRDLINTLRPFESDLHNRNTGAAAGPDETYPDLTIGKPIRHGVPEISDVFLSRIKNQPVVSILMPVWRNNKPHYTLKMVLEPIIFIELFRQQRLPHGWVAGLLDRKGISIARMVRPEKVGTRASPELLRQIPNSDEGVGSGRTQEGMAVYHAFARSKVTGWVTVTGVSQSLANAPFRKTLYQLAGGGVLLVLLSLAIALWLSKKLAKPITALADAAELIQRGENVQIGDSGVHEVSRLRHALFEAGAATRVSVEERERRIAAESREAEARNVRDKIAESDEQFRLLLGGIRDHAIFMLDADGCIATWNTGAERLTGFSYAAALGQPIDILYQIKDRTSGKPAQDLQAAGAAAEDSPYEREGCLMRHDGIKFHGNVTLAAVRKGNGDIRGYTCVIRDVTERKQADEALRANEDRFRRAADATGAVVYEATVLDDGPAWAYGIRNILGEDVDVGAVTSSWWHSRIHPEDIAAHREHLRLCITDRHCPAYSSQYRVRHSDGSWRNVKDIGQILRSPDGNAYRLVGTVVDITDSKQSEDALLRYAARLQEADQRKNEFLATLAHELRNPLAPIRNSIEILKAPQLNTEKFQMAREIAEHQVDHMVRLIDDLMDISRISRGKIELKRERVAIKPIIDQAVETSRPHIEENGHEISVSLPSAPVYLDADPMRLAQVLSNLINNACKYSKQKGKIEIRARLESIADLALVISIKDEGIGIAPEHLPRLFEMFSQVESSIERAQGGLGIGLSLVKGLVEMHGGKVEAKSEGIGKGSEFIIRLPALEFAPDMANPQPSLHSEFPTPRAEHKRVLVVDDNRAQAQSLELLLDAMGYEVRSAYDGASALALVGEFAPQIAMVDLGLPDMTGHELARRISAIDKGITLIAQTGWGREEDRERSRQAGFQYHLTKPIDPGLLQRIL